MHIKIPYDLVSHLAYDGFFAIGSAKFSFGYQLNVKVYDIDFEPGVLDDKDKEEVGFYISRNMKFIDCSDLEDPHTVMVPLRNAKPEEVVRVIV